MFQEAEFQDAEFQEALFQEAEFQDALFQEAEFHDALFQDAEFQRGVRLRGAVPRGGVERVASRRPSSGASTNLLRPAFGFGGLSCVDRLVDLISPTPPARPTRLSRSAAP